jgi:hypothetical protein
LKRVILVAAAALTLFTHSLAQAQEREPLAMRIELEWTLAGTVLGAVVGAALWLTDPGNPNSRLSRSVIEGAALGAVAGAGFGIYMIQRSVQYPTVGQVYDPLDPMNRPGRDPIAVQLQREDLLSNLERPGGRLSGKGRGYEITLANFNWRF